MTTDWDGQGLPPAAMARMERGRSSPVRSSLLSVPGHVGVEACGFTAVGEVMGCIVGASVSPAGPAVATAATASAAAASSAASGSEHNGHQRSGRRLGRVRALRRALYHGFDTALYRMLLECQSLGGDGVVGVRLEQHHLARAIANSRHWAQLSARRGATPGQMLSTTLNGQDFAKLFQGGWMAASVVIGISVAIRHDDWATRTRRAPGPTTQRCRATQSSSTT